MTATNALQIEKPANPDERTVGVYMHQVNMGTEEKPIWQPRYFHHPDKARKFSQTIACRSDEPSHVGVVHNTITGTYRRLGKEEPISVE
jgi:hypothetical protein